MLLLDTNVIVGLLDPRDQWHSTAARDLKRLQREELRTTTSVLSEVCYHLKHERYRLRLESVLRTTPIRLYGSPPPWESVIGWLLEYADQKPDWVDAELAVLSFFNAKVKVWTYDREFWTVWRRPNGSPIPLAVRPRA